ncbi:MAG: phosphoribosylformylglycinamidine synthase subunit PurS [Armatimonadota bacterium]|nr:phosphoribosylformylglycinamidine synthase subunit PurS [Armatimonadota bacterium]
MPKANVYITLKPSLLDAQGKVVQGALEKLGYTNVSAVRIGKYIQIELEGDGDLEQQVDDMCRKLLANPVIEDYRFEIER